MNVSTGPSTVVRGCLWLLLGLARCSQADPPTTSTVRYPVGGKMWAETELRTAYAQVRTFHVMDPGSQQVVPAGPQGAFPLRGRVRDRIRAETQQEPPPAPTGFDPLRWIVRLFESLVSPKHK